MTSSLKKMKPASCLAVILQNTNRGQVTEQAIMTATTTTTTTVVESAGEKRQVQHNAAMGPNMSLLSKQIR